MQFHYICNNFVGYLQLVSKIVCGKDNNAIEMNKYKFFKLLGMILEKLPKKYFDENILIFLYIKIFISARLN